MIIIIIIIIIVVTWVNWKCERFQKFIFEKFILNFDFFGKFSPLEKAIGIP
jgi:hypothetical protein